MKRHRHRAIRSTLFAFGILLASAFCPAAASPNAPAFPGAEGFGAYAKGGRGGKVMFVTNLLDYGKGEATIPGSLRTAVEAEGPRTVVFRISGVIPLKSALVISRPHVTVAGQTAPGDGICLKNNQLLVANTHDVILRHLRVRPGEDMHEEIDAIYIAHCENVIADHCSASWSTDEVFSLEGKNITVQWCIISEGLDRSFHPKGKHSKGSILRGTDGGVTSHHNLYAHNADRNPKLESLPDLPGMLLDFRNNVIYDWGYQTGYSGKDYGRLNYVANFLLPGASSSKNVRFAFRPGSDRTKAFLRENLMEGRAAESQNNDLLFKWDEASLDQVRATDPFPAPRLRTQPAAEARQLVLEQAGATLPKRDAIDRRIVKEAASGTGKIIDSQNDVGGWPELKSAPAPKDSDNDGMPDGWESAHGLKPNQPDNNDDPDGDGYTNLEEFLNFTDPQRADASPDHQEFVSALAQVDELNAKARPAIEKAAKEEKRVEAERKPLDIVVKISPTPGAAVQKIKVDIAGVPPMPMVLIPAGTFMMGSPETELFRKDDETQHKVTITKPFYLAVYTVTRGQFAAAMEKDIPTSADADAPQITVWNEAAWFCRNLSHATGRKFRLATEAEWEYACRAGTTTPFSTGETISTDQANFNGDRIYGPGKKGIYRDHLTPPGTFPPNAWGVCDLHGNFFEWCGDWTAPYPRGDQVDPQGPSKGRRRVMRGGNFSSHPAYLRSASRYDYDPKVDYAFRVVLETAAAAGAATARLDRNNLLVYRGGHGDPQPVKSVRDWQKRRAEIVRGMESVMGPLPGPAKRCALDVKIESEADFGAYVRRTITYASEPNSRVPAWLLIPKEALAGKRKFSAVLCPHPTGPVGDPDYARQLAARGYVTLTANYPWLGKYEPDLQTLGWQSGTMKGIWDNTRGLDLLDSLPYVKHGKYGAIGHSLGGHNSVYTAVFDERIQVIVSSCGLDSYLDYYGGDPKNWQPERGWCQTRYMLKLADYASRLEEIPFDFHEMIGALAPRAVFINAPLGDSNFKWDSVDRIAAAALPVFRLYGKPENFRVEHPDCGHDFPEAMRQIAYRLLDERLK